MKRPDALGLWFTISMEACLHEKVAFYSFQKNITAAPEKKNEILAQPEEK